MGTTSSKTKIVLTITKSILQLFLNIIFYVLVVLVILNLSRAAYDFSYQVFGNVVSEPTPGRDVEVQIKKGESTRDIARKLEVQKVVVNQYSFYLRAKLTISADKPILPGTYLLNTSMNYDKILETITDREAGQQEEEEKSTE